jgi:hypothetical protein
MATEVCSHCSKKLPFHSLKCKNAMIQCKWGACVIMKTRSKILEHETTCHHKPQLTLQTLEEQIDKIITKKEDIKYKTRIKIFNSLSSYFMSREQKNTDKLLELVVNLSEEDQFLDALLEKNIHKFVFDLACDEIKRSIGDARLVKSLNILGNFVSGNSKQTLKITNLGIVPIWALIITRVQGKYPTVARQFTFWSISNVLLDSAENVDMIFKEPDFIENLIWWLQHDKNKSQHEIMWIIYRICIRNIPKYMSELVVKGIILAIEDFMKQHVKCNNNTCTLRKKAKLCLKRFIHELLKT